MVYFSGISFAILPENDRTLFIEQLRELNNQGKIAFDSNFRVKLWDNLAQARQYYEALLPLIDIALVTFDDEAVLWGDNDEQETINRLQSFAIPLIVVKQGKQGAVFCQQGQQNFLCRQLRWNMKLGYHFGG